MMNAAHRFASHLPRAALVRLLGRRRGRFELPWPDGTELDRDADNAELAARLGRRFEADLAGLLNALADDELAAIAASEKVAPIRTALWRHGAALEAGTDRYIGTPLQPAPTVIAGRLVHLAPPRGPYARCAAYPRAIPAPAPAAPPTDEPDTVDDLLAAADRALGVRLGARGRDKGAWGAAAAQLLGVRERGAGEPDWRGDVEIKTVPVALDRDGHWRVTEDPAISMVNAAPIAKLQRVLWLARAPLDGGDATFLSWYLLDWDDDVARLVARYLHTRPKGPRGSLARGWYLHKRFFADAGLLASLNGVP